MATQFPMLVCMATLQTEAPVPINICVLGYMCNKVTSDRICLCMESCFACCFLALVSCPAWRASSLPDIANILKTNNIYIYIYINSCSVEPRSVKQT